MLLRTVRRNEATAAKRRLYFFLVDAVDGITAEVGEAGGQPEVSVDGGAWAGAGSIGTLTHVGSGQYYADVAQSVININNGLVIGRYKSANTTEARSLNALDVGGDLQDAIARKANTTKLDVTTGDLTIMEADGATERFTLTDEGMSGDVQTIQRA